MRPRKPMLDRLYFDSDGEEKVLDFEKSIEDQGFYTRGTAEERALQHATKSPRAVFDAGWLPEITIRPPKDNAVYKAKYMIPNKELRNAFYESINSGDIDVIEDDLLDSRMYVNRLWNLYNKSGKPTIKPISRRSQLPLRLAEKVGLLKYSDNRANYNPITNTMYVDPEYAAEEIIAELSHAYQFYGTDTPRNWKWMKQFLSRPNGDMVINNKNGYDTPGSLEHTAHKIIEPAFYRYVTDNHDYSSSPYNYEDAFQDIHTIYNNINDYFKPIKIGPKKGM